MNLRCLFLLGGGHGDRQRQRGTGRLGRGDFARREGKADTLGGIRGLIEKPRGRGTTLTADGLGGGQQAGGRSSGKQRELLSQFPVRIIVRINSSVNLYICIYVYSTTIRNSLCTNAHTDMSNNEKIEK